MQLNPSPAGSQALKKVIEFQQTEAEGTKGVSKHARMVSACGIVLAKQEQGQREMGREVEKDRLEQVRERPGAHGVPRLHSESQRGGREQRAALFWRSWCARSESSLALSSGAG